MDELSPQERMLLDALQFEDSPSVADASRVKRRVLMGAGLAASGAAAAVTAEVAIGSSPFAAPATAAAALTASSTTTVATSTVATTTTAGTGAATTVAVGTGTTFGLVKTIVLSGAIASLGGGAWWATHDAEPAPPNRMSEAMAPAPMPPKPTEQGEAPKELTADTPAESGDALSGEPEAPAPTIPKVAAKPKSPAVPSNSASTLKEEAALMSRAQAALQRGDTGAALVVLTEHREKFPRGVLAGEREAAVSVAYCKNGDPRGRERAARFVATYPDSPMVQRLQSACKLSME